MNPVSIIPAPVAAQISGTGSFFGSCQIASGNFEDILNAMSENVMPDTISNIAPDIVPDIAPDIMSNIVPNTMSELPVANNNSKNFVEQPMPLAFQDFDKSEVLMQLQQILGEHAQAEDYERITNLLEKGTLSVQADTINWDKNTFEKLTVSLLERLDIAIKQIKKISSDVQDINAQGYEKDFDIRKFLNLISDLLKTGMITPQEYETVFKNPEESSLPELLGELKKEAGELIETLESVETEQIAEPWHAEEPKQAEKPRQSEQTRHVERPKQVEQPRQPKYAEQLIQAEQPRQTEGFRHIEYSWQAEQPKQVEQPPQVEQPKQVKQPWQTEVHRQVEQPRQVAQTRPIEQYLQVELPKLAEQPRQIEQSEQIEPLLEELSVISMETEMGIKPKDKVKFYELVNNLLDKGLINEQDLKDAIKIPTMDNKSKENKEIKLEKTEPVVIKNVLEKLWTSFESENKVEKENVFSKLKEIVESKSITVEKTEIKFAKVEVEVRAIWDAGDLKIETVNPKTGEKLQSIPVANSHRMQERINEFEVVRQVVSQAKFITTPTGEQKMTMQLRPDHLGQMNLRIVLNNGEMQIHARVESATAQTALESHIGLLREGLEKQGINLERLEVSVEQRDRQDAFSLAERQEQQERHGKGRHHHGKETHLAVSVKSDVSSDTGRRLGYNTMEYLA